jgi:putative ABC transport system permease protein
MRRLLPRPTAADRGFALLLALLCAGIVGATAGSSLWLRETADDLTRRVYAEAPYPATQLQVYYATVFENTVPHSAAGEVNDAVAPSVDALYAEPRHSVVTREVSPAALPRRSGEPSFVSVASMPDLERRVELVDGRMPDPGDPAIALPPAVAAEYEGPSTTQVVEVVLQEDAAAAMHLPIGTWFEQSSTRYRGGTGRPVLVRVVGTYRAAEPYPSPLDDVPNARRPAISVQPEFNLVRATALAADEETVLRASWVERPDVRFTFDPLRSPTSSESDALVTEARALTLQAWPPVLDANDAGAATGVGEIASQVAAYRSTSDGVSTLALTAVAGAALVVLLAAAVVLAGRRESLTAVVRARGASYPWLLAQRGGEALLIAAPGVVLAVALLAVREGGVPATGDLVAAVGAGLVCAGLMTAAQTVPRGIGGDRFQGVIRDAVQLVLVGLAVAVTAVVLRRETLDPLDPVTLVLAPLVGAAAGVLVMRLLQVVVGVLRRAARGSRPVSPVVGLSQAASMGQQVVVACVAIVLAVSSAVLGVSVGDTLRSNAERTGWEQVGADTLVVAPGLNDDVVAQVAALPGVESVAAVFSADSVSLGTRTGIEGVRVIGVDPEALAAAGDGGPLPVEVPQSGGGQLRAVASPDLVLDDETAELRYAQSSVPVHVSGRVARIPGVTNGESFIAFDLPSLAAAVDRTLAIYDTLLIAGDVDVEAVAAIVRERAPDAVVESREQVVDSQLGQPVVERTIRVLVAVAAVAALVAVFAVVLVVALGAPTRRRTSTLLRAIGADPRQARRSAVLGLVPVIGAACLAAAGCGVVLTVVAGRGLDLASLTETLATLPVRPTQVTGGVVAAGLVGLVVLAAAVAARRTSQGEIALDDLERERR